MRLSKQASRIHMDVCNAPTLVWGSLRLAPNIGTTWNLVSPLIPHMVSLCKLNNVIETKEDIIYIVNHAVDVIANSSAAIIFNGHRLLPQIYWKTLQHSGNNNFICKLTNQLALSNSGSCSQSIDCALLVYSGHSGSAGYSGISFPLLQIQFWDDPFCKPLSLLFLGHPHQYMVERNGQESGKSNCHRCVHHSSLISISQCSEQCCWGENSQVEKGVLYEVKYNVFIDATKSSCNAEGSNNDSQETDGWISKHIHWKDLANRELFFQIWYQDVILNMSSY